MMNRRAIIVGCVTVGVGGYLWGVYTVSERHRPYGSAKLSEDIPLTRPYSPTLGPDDAPVTIVEFFDPACEACRAFYPLVKEIMKEHDGQVRVVLRYAAFHPTSEEAIRILEAARIQGMFTPVLETLLEEQPVWAPHGREPGNVWEIAAIAGLDIEKARRDALLPDIVAILNRDATDVEAVGVTGTPTFFVNRIPLTETDPKQLKDLVNAEIDAL
ncbi:MAG: thioredoxin domain-containing protein [Rhodospirillales bacterium]